MKLIDDWKRCWSFASVQVLTLIVMLPDIYNGLAAMGWLEELPAPAKWAIRGMGALGIVARVMQRGGRDGDRQHP